MTAIQIDPALIQQAEAIARLRGVSVDTIIRDALSEAFRAEAYFNERARRANPKKALAILARAGIGNPPDEGDELPEGWAARE